MTSRSGPLRIALISPGAMGSAIGARLRDEGHALFTALTARSAASRARAEAAGMRHAEDDALAACDIILSILPPADAADLVERLLPHIAAQKTKPLFVDANALNPATKKALATRLATVGCEMVDGAILGPPPGSDTRATTLLLSGDAAERASVLATLACPTKIIAGGIGAASAVKMCFGGINKGIVGLAAVLLLAAERHGAADALKAEMAHHMPDLFTRYQRQVPDMFPKAYRWIAEMEEISAFLGDDDPAGAETFRGIAAMFARIAGDVAGERRDVAVLEQALRVS